MATFKQAIKWLKEGKKVRRPIWEEDSYWTTTSNYGLILFSDGTQAKVYLRQLEEKDWEVYKEPKEKKFYCRKCKTEVNFGDRNCSSCGKEQLWALYG